MMLSHGQLVALQRTVGPERIDQAWRAGDEGPRSAPRSTMPVSAVTMFSGGETTRESVGGRGCKIGNVRGRAGRQIATVCDLHA